jgi:hypothetical protein
MISAGNASPRVENQGLRDEINRLRSNIRDDHCATDRQTAIPAIKKNPVNSGFPGDLEINFS